MRRILWPALLAILAGCGEPTPLPNPGLIPLDDPAKLVRLSDFKGKTVLLDFWATWCGPCQVAMPEVQRLWNRYQHRGLVVVAVSSEDRDVVQPFHANAPFTYPVYLDPKGEAERVFKIESLPTFVLLRDGVVLWRQSGYSPGDVDSAVRAELEP